MFELICAKSLAAKVSLKNDCYYTATNMGQQDGRKIEVNVQKPLLVLHKAVIQTHTSTGPCFTLISTKSFMTDQNRFKMLIWAAECQTCTI